MKTIIKIGLVMVLCVGLLLVAGCKKNAGTKETPATTQPTTQPTTKPEEETTKPTTKPTGSNTNKPVQDGSNASTGDNMMLFVMLMLFSLMGIGAATILRKKEEI